jgi:putative tryptophan/tyrosine transport system substrate-binding protein
MARKAIIVLLVGLALASVRLAEAQQPNKVPRIGYLTRAGSPPAAPAFVQGLRDLGYIEGKNIVIEHRPGGNVTGLSSVSHDLSGKRLELLKEAIPKASIVGVLYDPE